MLFISTICFLIGAFISIYRQKYNAPERVTKRLNAQISKALFNLELRIESISTIIFYKQNQINTFINDKYKDEFKSNGIELLIYRNDSLKFWTANVFAAPQIKSIDDFTSDIIRNGSGYYLMHKRLIGKYLIIGLQLIHYNYIYSNDYLPSGFFKQFKVPRNTILILEAGEYNILNPQGKFLFSLSFRSKLEIESWASYLILLSYIASFCFFISAFFWGHVLFLIGFNQRLLTIIIFIVNLFIWRAFQFYFHIPFFLYENMIFSPVYYAYSNLLPSLGDLLINVLLVLIVTSYINKYIISYRKAFGNRLLMFEFIPFMLLGFVVIIFFYLNSMIENLILNSSISFRCDNLLSLYHGSFIGVVIIAILILTYNFLIQIIAKFIFFYSSKAYRYIYSSAIWMLIYIYYTYLNSQFDHIDIVFLLFILIYVYFISQKKFSKRNQFIKILGLIIILSANATYCLKKHMSLREHEQRKILATYLSDARDNMAEYYYNEAVRSIKNDSTLKLLFIDFCSKNMQNTATEYIKNKYFSGYWSKYQVQITICDPEIELQIKPENITTNCDEYFKRYMNRFMHQVSVSGLFFLKQSIDAMYYLGKIELQFNVGRRSMNRNIYIEIISKKIWKGLGYPELLIDRKTNSMENLTDYSYAFYKKGELVKHSGKFSYDIEEIGVDSLDVFINMKGYNHYLYRPESNTTIIISIENPFFTYIIAPFYYLFLLQVMIYLFIEMFSNFGFSKRNRILTLRLRLQIILLAVIVVSSIILVSMSVIFINHLNINKNKEILYEKMNSILIDIENRFTNNKTMDEVNKEELSDLLVDLSNIYFSDINIFNSNGFLIASSRDQVFKDGMVSEQINPISAWQLLVEKKAFIVQREEIGNYFYLSAYAPIRNNENIILGYLNLPFFARQEEMNKELSGLISAYANIYLIMLIICVILALTLSRTITKPLQHIGNQLDGVKIGKTNEKIEWKRSDEIGTLVNAYNRMIDELGKSAELLARSERESAWREMAKQVAHEIKNPLTPIKLSMQLLMKAWHDKTPDWEARLKRFSQTLIIQIDTLSSIASEFSDFAQMPEPEIVKLNIIPLLEQSASLFREQSDCRIIVETQEEYCFIKADQNQMLRVFNNLIKNALQAIPSNTQGLILINLSKKNNTCHISFKDNGSGIDEEKREQIFSPNFTTKNTGMGLGLAMVKNIIDNSSGQIWFESELGIGTIFYIALPIEI